MILTPGRLPARQAPWEPEMGANVFRRPQTQRDVARISSQVKGSPLGHGDPKAASILGNALAIARGGGFCNTVVITASEVASYLVEHATPGRSDPFSEQLITAAVQVRSARPGLPARPRCQRAADPRRGTRPQAPADQHLSADRSQPLHCPVHGQDPSSGHLPESGGGVALGGSRAGRRATPALTPFMRPRRPGRLRR